MDNKKEYLNEEWYQKTKKRITKISLIILIIAIVIGSGLIATGIIATDISKKEAEKLNKERYEAAYNESKQNVAEAKKRLQEIINERATIKKQYDEKQYECNSLDMSASNWLANKQKCSSEASEIYSKIEALDDETDEINNKDYTGYYDLAVAKDYKLVIIIGIILICDGIVVSLTFYIISKKREIKAFTTQQMMPIKQESIKKITPTVANSAETISNSISNGITEQKNISNDTQDKLSE